MSIVNGSFESISESGGIDCSGSQTRIQPILHHHHYQQLSEAKPHFNWIKVLPNILNDAMLWLEEHEQVTDILPLPSEQKKHGGLPW